MVRLLRRLATRRWSTANGAAAAGGEIYGVGGRGGLRLLFHFLVEETKASSNAKQSALYVCSTWHLTVTPRRHPNTTLTFISSHCQGRASRNARTTTRVLLAVEIMALLHPFLGFG